MSEELKACPFCGGEQTATAPELLGWWAGCKACSGGIGHATEAEAITSWNTRADPALAAAQADVARLTAENSKLRRCLMPVWMTIAEHDMIKEPLPDDARVLSFMGSGASDFVTAGEIRAALVTP